MACVLECVRCGCILCDCWFQIQSVVSFTRPPSSEPCRVAIRRAAYNHTIRCTELPPVCYSSHISRAGILCLFIFPPPRNGIACRSCQGYVALSQRAQTGEELGYHSRQIITGQPDHDARLSAASSGPSLYRLLQLEGCMRHTRPEVSVGLVRLITRGISPCSNLHSEGTINSFFSMQLQPLRVASLEERIN